MFGTIVNVLLCAQAIFTIGFVIVHSFQKDTECDSCRQRRLWKEGWDADTVLRNEG